MKKINSNLYIDRKSLNDYVKLILTTSDKAILHNNKSVYDVLSTESSYTPPLKVSKGNLDFLFNNGHILKDNG